MLAWGWRVPFLLSAILVIVGLVVRVHMEETPIFRMAQEQKKVVKSPLTEVFRKSWRQVLQATFLVAVTYTLFYTLATWSLAWGTKEQGEGGGNLGFTNQEYLLMLMISICVFALFIVLSCVYADRIGRRRVIVFSSCALVVFAFAFPFLLDGGLVILESLCLKKVVGRTDLMLFALPLKFENADGAPVRAIAEFRDFPEEKEMEAL